MVNEEIRSTNPAARVKAPETGRTPIRILTPREIADVVAALPDPWRAFVLLDAYSSLRWSELVYGRRLALRQGRRLLARMDEAYRGRSRLSRDQRHGCDFPTTRAYLDADGHAVYVEIYPEASRAVADGIDEMVRAATIRE